MAANLDEFQPSGFGVEYDLEAFEKSQRAEEKRKDKLVEAEIRLKNEAARQKEIRRDNRNEVFHWIACGALILGILSGIVYGCTAWYQHSYQENAKKWVAWVQQCDKAGGIPVGERSDLVCTFTDAALPWGDPYYSASSWDKKNGAVWVDNCDRAGGNPVGWEGRSICTFPTGASLPYGKMVY